MMERGDHRTSASNPSAARRAARGGLDDDDLGKGQEIVEPDVDVLLSGPGEKASSAVSERAAAGGGLEDEGLGGPEPVDAETDTAP